MTSLKEKIYSQIDGMEKELISYAQELIKFPTVSGQEKEAQEYVRKVLEKDLGFDEIDIWEPDIEEMRGHKAFITQREDFKGSPNVVGTLKGAGGGKSIILNSHIDVVPEGSHDEWCHPPFQGEVAEGKIYGRGASDMKVTKASFFIALKALQQLGLKLKGDVLIQSVIEEEAGSAGTLACVLRGYKADAAILPEPSVFKICPATQGSTWFRVNLYGLSAHGGKRYEGVSALEKLPQVISTIQQLEIYRNEKYAHPLYKDVPIPFCINIGNVEGGSWPSTVPEKVSIEGRMGIPPAEELEDGWRMFEEWIDKTAETDAWMKEHKPDVEWFGAFWGSGQIDMEHPIVKTAEQSYQEVTGMSPVLAGTPWATDARVLIDFADTPALVFGPGHTAHCPDEYMVVEDLVNYTKMLASMLVDWCGYQE